MLPFAACDAVCRAPGAHRCIFLGGRYDANEAKCAGADRVALGALKCFDTPCLLGSPRRPSFRAWAGHPVPPLARVLIRTPSTTGGLTTSRRLTPSWPASRAASTQRLSSRSSSRMRALISVVRRFRSAADSALAGAGSRSICRCRRAITCSALTQARKATGSLASRCRASRPAPAMMALRVSTLPRSPSP